MDIVHPLRPDDAVIFGCAQAGCQACVAALLVRHEGLVHYIVRNEIWGGVPEEDLLQEGRIALWRAIQGYDPGRGVAFSTYASMAIKRQVWAVTAQERRQRQGMLEADAKDAYLELESRLWQEQVDQVVAEASCYLTARQRQVLSLVYAGAGEPSGDAEPTLGNLAAAGRSLGFSREWVRRLHQDALAVLRLPAFSVHLRQLCEQDSRDAYVHSRQLSRQWLRKGRRP